MEKILDHVLFYISYMYFNFYVVIDWLLFIIIPLITLILVCLRLQRSSLRVNIFKVNGLRGGVQFSLTSHSVSIKILLFPYFHYCYVVARKHLQQAFSLDIGNCVVKIIS